MRGNRFKQWLGAAMLAAAGTALASGAYPSKPVRMLVGMAPGGSNDVIARLISTELSQRLGQPFVVENKAGANSTIATNETKRAEPDGYNLMIVISSHVTNPLLYKNVGYELKDFEYISVVADSSFLLVTNPQSGLNSYADIQKASQQQPLDFGSPGLGSTQHVAMELMSQMGGIQFNHIPYRGGAPAQADLLAGVIPLIFATPAQSLATIRAGQLKPIAVTTAERIDALPDVPTLAQAGVPQYEANVWFGIVAPKGTPAEVVQLLERHIGEIVQQDNIKRRFEELGLQPQGSSSQAFSSLIDAEAAKWAEVVDKAQIVMQ